MTARSAYSWASLARVRPKRMAVRECIIPILVMLNPALRPLAPWPMKSASRIAIRIVGSARCRKWAVDRPV